MARMNELQQAKAIAKHYCSLPTVSLDLLGIISMMEHNLEKGNDCEEAMQTVHYMTTMIKELHANDFGIELKWEDAEQ